MCSNDDRRLIFDLFTARSNLRPHAFVRGTVVKSVFQNLLKANG